MDSVDEVRAESAAETAAGSGASIQAGSYLLELSLDWIVLRASENIHHLLGESHVTLIEEPLGRFVHSQARSWSSGTEPSRHSGTEPSAMRRT